MKQLPQKSIELALRDEGVREVGHSNTGAEVSRWLERVGSTNGEPWCAAWAWCKTDDAARELGVANPYLRSAYCPDIGNWARRRSILKSTPQAGDHFLQIHGDDFHHTGIVIAANANETFDHISGNTNTDGAREGVAVAIHRNVELTARFAFVRYADLINDETAPTRSLILGDKKVCDMPVVNGLSLAPIRKWCAWMGAKLDWNPDREPPFIINGKGLDTAVSLLDGSAYCPLRALVAMYPALGVTFDPATQSVTVKRKEGA